MVVSRYQCPFSSLEINKTRQKHFRKPLASIASSSFLSFTNDEKRVETEQSWIHCGTLPDCGVGSSGLGCTSGGLISGRFSVSWLLARTRFVTSWVRYNISGIAIDAPVTFLSRDTVCCNFLFKIRPWCRLPRRWAYKTRQAGKHTTKSLPFLNGGIFVQSAHRYCPVSVTTYSSCGTVSKRSCDCLRLSDYKEKKNRKCIPPYNFAVTHDICDDFHEQFA